MDASLGARPHAIANGEGELSPLEQEVLDEYAKLAGNLDNVRSHSINTFRSGVPDDYHSFPPSLRNWPQTRQWRSSMRYAAWNARPLPYSRC